MSSHFKFWERWLAGVRRLLMFRSRRTTAERKTPDARVMPPKPRAVWSPRGKY